METKYIYGAVALLVILVILFLVIRKRGSDSSTPTDDKRDTVGPTIEVGNLQATQNPDKSDNTVEKTSSYIIRASEGYAEEGDFDDKELSKNIQLGLTWNNGGGFDNVDEIRVKWEQQVPDPDDATKTKNVVRMTEVIKKNTDTTKYFTQYFSNLSHTFTANMKKPVGDAEALPMDDDKKFSAVGTNMIHVYYLDKDNNEVRLTDDDVQTYVVTVDHLSATKDLLSAKTYTYKPTTGGATISATISDNEYYMYSVGTSQDIIKHIDSTKSGKIVILPEGENADNDIVRLRVNVNGDVDKHFLKIGDGGKIIIEKTNEAAGDNYKFATVAGKDSDHIRFRQTGEGDNKNKFMMVDFNDKKLKIKNYTTIDDLCTNNSLDFILSKTEVSIASCVSGVDFKNGDSLGTTNYIHNTNDPKNGPTKLAFSWKVQGVEKGYIYLKLKDGEPEVNAEGKATFVIENVDDDDDYYSVYHVPKPEDVTGEWQGTTTVGTRKDFTVKTLNPKQSDYDTKYYVYRRLSNGGNYKFESLGYFQLQQ